MPRQYTEVLAPYPNHKVTMLLPKPRFEDVRRSESRVHVKHTMLGERWTYVDSSSKYTLSLPFELTRAKSIELERFLDVYKAAPMKLLLYDDTDWNVTLVDVQVPRTTRGRIGDQALTGGEFVEVTLVFSGTELT